MPEYQLVVTPEQAAVLEAAIGPLSAPAPNEETGERDLRPAGQRRVEARRGVPPPHRGRMRTAGVRRVPGRPGGLRRQQWPCRTCRS